MLLVYWMQNLMINKDSVNFVVIQTDNLNMSSYNLYDNYDQKIHTEILLTSLGGRLSSLISLKGIKGLIDAT